MIDTYGGKEYNLTSSNQYLAEIKLEMDDGSDRSPYINGRINTTNPKQVLLNLGNGYPEISNAKLILGIKAGTQTMNIYYTNR